MFKTSVEVLFTINQSNDYSINETKMFNVHISSWLISLTLYDYS